MSESRRRIGAALSLGVAAVAGAPAAEPLTGSPGATVGVGAGVAAIVLLLLAIAIWPYSWSDAERDHRALEWIWRRVRPDADQAVAWERYAAWAEPAGEQVELQLICRAPAAERLAGAPSPFNRSVVRRLSPADMEGAAEAMERLREEAAERERRARERHELAGLEAATRAHDAKLSQIEREAAADLAAREQQLCREFAGQEAAERRAQAQAVARALRRP